MVLVALLATPALAADPRPHSCIDLAAAKKFVADQHGNWVGLTIDQMQFLRGISVINPATPPGIPPGNAAAMALAPSKESALVFFLDGKRACDMMPIPDVVKKMVMDVGAGVVNHNEGSGL